MKDNNLIDLGIDTKIGVAANNYLNNPNPDNLEKFKEELAHSSYLHMTAVIEKLFIQTEKKDKCKELIDLIISYYKPEEKQDLVYNPMRGDFITKDDDTKNIKM